MSFTTTGTVTTPTLEIGYEAAGDPGGPPVILLHGFPYDVRSYDAVAPLVADHGAWVIAPYLRGFGPTRFRDPDTLRSGQQGALAQDLVDLMDALRIDRAVLAGYDWGGRAACIVAALWPERVAGLVTVDGYTVQDIARSAEPAPPASEAKYWYQFYFNLERGRRGLAQHREALCEQLWREWSPTWSGAGAAFPATAPSLHNPDFVDVVIHSYRHRYGNAPGDPRHAAIEAWLAASPPISVPTIAIDAAADGLGGYDPAADRDRFTGPFEVRTFPGTGHNPPQEDPAAFARAVIDLLPGR